MCCVEKINDLSFFFLSYDRCTSLVGSLGSLWSYKRFLTCLDCCSRPSTTYLFPHHTLFNVICHHSQSGTIYIYLEVKGSGWSMGLFYCLNPLCCQLYYHTQTLTPTLYQKRKKIVGFFVVNRIYRTLVFSA